MNSYLRNLIRNRELEYEQELAKESSHDDEDADSSTSILSQVDDDHLTNIRVTILEDNPKGARTNVGTLSPSLSSSCHGAISQRNQLPRQPPTRSLSLSNLDSGAPTPPRIPAIRKSLRSKRRRSRNNKPADSSSRHAYSQNGRFHEFQNKVAITSSSGNTKGLLRWGEGDDSPTSIPQCPKRASLSPVQSDEGGSPFQRPSLPAMAATIVSQATTELGVCLDSSTMPSATNSALRLEGSPKATNNFTWNAE